MVNLDKFKHGILVQEEEKHTDTDPSSRQNVFPYISVCQATPFSDAAALSSLSCLQITDVGVYFNWRSSNMRSSLDVVMQSKPAADARSSSESPTSKDSFGLNEDSGSSSGDEVKGDENSSITALEDSPVQGDVAHSSTSASNLTPLAGSPEHIEHEPDNEVLGMYFMLADRLADPSCRIDG